MTNKGFQKHNVDRLLKKKGIEDFDSESHVDSELSLKENLDSIEDEIGISLRDETPDSGKEVRERQSKGDKRQADMRHESRSEQAQLVDESMEAEKVFELPLEEGEFETWAENPDEYDIPGVDLK